MITDCRRPTRCGDGFRFVAGRLITATLFCTVLQKPLSNGYRLAARLVGGLGKYDHVTPVLYATRFTGC